MSASIIKPSVPGVTLQTSLQFPLQVETTNNLLFLHWAHVSSNPESRQWLVDNGYLDPSTEWFTEKWQEAINADHALNQTIENYLESEEEFEGFIHTDDCLLKLAGEQVALTH